MRQRLGRPNRQFDRPLYSERLRQCGPGLEASTPPPWERGPRLPGRWRALVHADRLGQSRLMGRDEARLLGCGLFLMRLAIRCLAADGKVARPQPLSQLLLLASLDEALDLTIARH